jgi:hypothetical protein
MHPGRTFTSEFTKLAYHFGVGLGFENMPLAQEESAQLTKVLDFSVENNPYGTVFIRERLLPTVEVDD